MSSEFTHNGGIRRASFAVCVEISSTASCLLMRTTRGCVGEETICVCVLSFRPFLWLKRHRTSWLLARSLAASVVSARATARDDHVKHHNKARSVFQPTRNVYQGVQDGKAYATGYNFHISVGEWGLICSIVVLLLFNTACDIIKCTIAESSNSPCALWSASISLCCPISTFLRSLA